MYVYMYAPYYGNQYCLIFPYIFCLITTAALKMANFFFSVPKVSQNRYIGRIVDSEQLLLVKLKCLCAIKIDTKYFRKEMQNSMCGGGFSKLLLAVADVTFAVFG